MAAESHIQKNIKLGYLLMFLHSSFFWYAPWLLFLLKFISFEQAAIIQSIGLFTSVVLEIPTGALSDLIGKKKTLHVAFFLASAGELYMAFSTQFWQFAIAYVVIYTGYTFYSGTMEAFMYDTLASENKTDMFKQVISRSTAIKNSALVIASLAGGFLFGIWVGFPFFLTGVAKFAGLIVTLFIDEPAVDTEKFSLKAYVRQTRKGFSQLFGPKLKWFSLFIFTFVVFNVPIYEILDDMTFIDYGYDAKGIGFLLATSALLSVFASLLYEKVSHRIKPLYLVFGGPALLILNYIFHPWIGISIWTAFFFCRIAYSSLRDNAISDIINHNTDSKIRTTTLSTFSMITVAPFVLLSSSIAGVSQGVGLRNFTMVYVAVLLILLIPQAVGLVKKGVS